MSVDTLNQTSKYRAENAVISSVISVTIIDGTNKPTKIDLRKFEKSGKIDDIAEALLLAVYGLKKYLNK